MAFGQGAGAPTEQELLEALRQADPVSAERAADDLMLMWSRSGSAAMDLLLERGREALAAGDTEAAIAHLTALTDHAPDFAEGWNARAIAFFHAGMYGPAIADIVHVLSLNPNHFGAMTGLAVMLEEMGDYQGAIEMHRRVQAIHPTYPGTADALARLQQLVGGATL